MSNNLLNSNGNAVNDKNDVAKGKADQKMANKKYKDENVRNWEGNIRD